MFVMCLLVKQIPSSFAYFFLAGKRDDDPRLNEDSELFGPLRTNRKRRARATAPKRRAVPQPKSAPVVLLDDSDSDHNMVQISDGESDQEAAAASSVPAVGRGHNNGGEIL